jgi:hypothetical protein
MHVSNDKVENARRLQESQDKYLNLLHETEGLRLQNGNLQNQLKLAQNDSELMRSEIYSMKQANFDKEKRELALIASLERTSTELNQTKLLLSKADQANEVIKTSTHSLIHV